MKEKKIVLRLILILLIIGIIHITINAISIYNNPFTSFPWYSAIFFTGLYYLPLLIILAIAYIYFSYRDKNI